MAVALSEGQAAQALALLAVASAAIDERGEEEEEEEEDEGEEEKDGDDGCGDKKKKQPKTATTTTKKKPASSSYSPAAASLLDSFDVPSTAASLRDARALALRAAAGGVRFDANLARAVAASAASVGAAAAGVLHAAAVCLQDPEWWRSPAAGGPTAAMAASSDPNFEALPPAASACPALVLALAAALPPARALGRGAAAVVGGALRAAGNARPDASRALADILAFLVARGGQTEAGLAEAEALASFLFSVFFGFRGQKVSR